jgi:hypothetical protein
MPLINSWHCNNNLLAGQVVSSDCYVTGYGNATTTMPTSTPMYVQDSGDLTFELLWVIFFLSIIFMGVVFNSFTASSKSL